MKKIGSLVLALMLLASFACAALAEAEAPLPPSGEQQVEVPSISGPIEQSEADRLDLDLPGLPARYGAAKDATITVSGNATLLAPADTATVRLGVTESAQNVLDAQSAMNAKIEAIRNALLESGIEEKSINTDRLNIYATYTYGDDGAERIAGYTASSTLSIVTKDMDGTGAIIDTAFAAGANTLNGIDFSVENPDEAMDQAYVQAMLDAHDKAELLAQTEGASVRGVISISQGSSYSYDSMANSVRATFAEGASADAGTFVQAALIEISASVTVTYELQTLPETPELP